MKALLVISMTLFALQLLAADEHDTKFLKGSPIKGQVVVKKGETVGEFESIDWGDMPHVNILVKGKKMSFFAGRGPWEVFEKYQKELKGTKIKIIWERVQNYNNYAGSNLETTQTSDICAFKNISYEAQEKKIAVCK